MGLENIVEPVSGNSSLSANAKSIELYLEKDNLRVCGQNFAVISCISPTSNQKYDKIAIKIRGVFDTLDSARSHATKLHKADDTFDIHVVEMYSWLAMPPDATNLGEVHFSDPKLEELIIGHKEQQEMSAIEFEKYKRDMLEYGKKHATESAAREAERLALEKNDTITEESDEISVEAVPVQDINLGPSENADETQNLN